ncbi:hypothetical protein [Laspinema olomoucense]|uniref:Uncharacterized protein n=1 Tax=Laspinema olomoucense D3b TaxID=2953688 RepID=A0ABT2N3U7_9CYAN|nr:MULTISPECIES: hypothetical protein [unclassified Laspinema]MCT7974851.1 hypothetical protein [Laspinema sp. D3d]MCT7977366.1 hypothetical protein [Laspinema sp. D3b]
MISITYTRPKPSDLTSAAGTRRPGVEARINGYFPSTESVFPNPVVKDLRLEQSYLSH